MEEMQQKGEAWKSVAPPLQNIQKINSQYTQAQNNCHTHTHFYTTQQNTCLGNSKGKEQKICMNVV